STTAAAVNNGGGGGAGESSAADLSKKRRKQSTPIRISALSSDTGGANNGVGEEMMLESLTEKSVDVVQKAALLFGHLQQLQESQSPQDQSTNEINFASFVVTEMKSQSTDASEDDEEAANRSPGMMNCTERPQDITGDPLEAGEKVSETPIIRVKKEPSEWDSDDRRTEATNSSKQDDWLASLANAGLPFPFPPEAAAALTAGGYLPLLGVPPVAPFTTNADGLPLPRPTAPQLRIFNPEAYCDLCNKEFCNKYFLKTHKANKHGIYETPVPTVNDVAQAGERQAQQMHQSMAQVFQQQQQQQQQSPQSLMPPEPTVFCDICYKKFTNIFAMRRHRAKVHEVDDGKMEQDTFDSDTQTFRLPDDFRQDFTVEQEDTNFTPQPRKLSPASSQQAREANFSVEKLKRLGVINPEAFCELCCKEYCNKYFLRTHKLKRHGILMPPDETKENFGDRNPWHYVQTSPLNLIMGTDFGQVQQLQQKMLSEIAERPLKSPADKVPASDGKFSGDLIKSENEEKVSESKSPRRTPTSPQNTSQGDTDAISVDLQKLQSMILQLNDLNAQRATQCTVCGKEQENQYMLHAHMIAEHGNIASAAVENIKTSRSSTPAPLTQPSITSQGSAEVCKQCDKEFPSSGALKQHIVETHTSSASPPLPNREGFVTPERPIFMKTHMQRMHGIEIENGAQIGGVICNICNKELCSKYFLRVHKHNTHGIVEEGSPLPQSRQNGDHVKTDITATDESPGFSGVDGGGNMKPSDLADLSNRYFSHFTEVCPLCSRRFRSSKWLRAHLMSDHGKAGTDKLRDIEQRLNLAKAQSPTLKIPNGAFGLAAEASALKSSLSGLFMTPPGPPNVATSMADEATMNSGGSGRMKEYQCSFCSFSTPYYAFLFIHERSHTLINPAAVASLTAAAPHRNPPSSHQSEAAVSLAKGATNDAASAPPTMTKSESNSMLTDMANLTQRPAIYALPQDSEPMIMQSFLLEEAAAVASESTKDTNRFVPAVVFLPVRERITTSITVSFSLTPA
uniref:C2H2-type domain-containing protein n=1 Tax=Phlebotomus papatasi TaxID=29031 RepID=A0A1B0CZS8_PHLPP